MPAFERVGVHAVVEGLGQYERGARKVEAAQGRMGASAQRAAKQSGMLGKALKGIGTIATGMLVARGIMAAPQILMGITSTARDLELQMNKANIVFGEQIDVVHEWAAENARAMGLSRRAATNLAAQMGDLLIPMGMARDEAADLATETIGLAGALAEWSGGTKTAAEVADILTKAMLGEREQLKTLGISLTEVDVSSRLAAKGQEELTGKALAQARAVATQELIFEKSTDAQAAYADGAGTAARKQAQMTAQIEEAKEAISLALAPAISELTTLLVKVAVPALEAGAKGFERLVDASSQVFRTLDKNKDLLIAFGAVALGAVLIPQLVGAVTGLWKLYAVLRAIAVARHINMLQVVIQSLAMPAIGLPALAIGAAAAGLALFGLGRHFFGASKAADRFAEAQALVNEELEKAERLAAVKGLEQTEARIVQIADAYHGLQKEMDALRGAGEPLVQQFKEMTTSVGPLSDEAQALQLRILALTERYADAEDKQEAYRQEADKLRPTLTELATAADELGIPLDYLVPLFPELGSAAEEAGEDVKTFANTDVKALIERSGDLAEALGGVVEGLSGVRREIGKLTGVETKEEAVLRAQISARELTIARGKEWVRVQQRQMTPAEQAQIGLIEDQVTALEGQLDLIGLTKEAGEDYAVVLSGKLAPSLEEQLELMGALTEDLSDQSVMSDLAATRAAILKEKMDKLRKDGFEKTSSSLERGLLVQLAELAGIEIKTEVDVDTTLAERDVLHLRDLMKEELPREYWIKTLIDTSAVEGSVRQINRWLEGVPQRIAAAVEPLGLRELQGRQFGGPVTAGQPYRVGEGGRSEVFVPHTSGTILPNPATLIHAGQRVFQPQINAPMDLSFNSSVELDWAGVRRTVHNLVDEALDAARSQSNRAGFPIGGEIG